MSKTVKTRCNMKKIRIFALSAAFATTLSVFPMLVSGDEAIYNSEEDPLVSLSYINEVITPAYDEKIDELTETVNELLQSVSDLTDALEDSEAKVSELEAAIGTPSESALGQYEVVYLKKGAKLLAETPCEIILRSGSAIAVSITVNGLNNVTDGSELLNAADIPLFNQLLVPRGGDGRGIQITSEDAYIMVRGDYSVVE